MLTLSIKHSVPANIAPIRAKFFAYDTVRAFISWRTSLTVGVSVPVIFGSMPAVNKPNAPPITHPKIKLHALNYRNYLWYMYFKAPMCYQCVNKVEASKT